MGFADLAQKLAQTAFKIAGDIPVTCTYTSVGTAVYADGAYTSTDVDYASLKFLFGDYQSNEVDGTVILSTDQRMSIPQLDLTPVPKKQDYLTDADSVKWQIEGISKDPARALWILQGRKI